MSTTIRSKIVKIGNSRGIRIPRALLEQAGLSTDVEMTVEGNNLIIHTIYNPRGGWEMQFKSMAEHEDDRLFDVPSSNQWDQDEWEW
jgi:antitoxin MazE